MGIRFRNVFNFPASNIINFYFFTLYVAGVALALALEGDILEFESEAKLHLMSK